jgi:3-oxoadipate enol-lactonase
VALPPGGVVHVPGRGEFFLRDSGGEGSPVLLLHGWMFSADLNWWRAYGALERAGYRVLALDHRGHGRGLRTPIPFRLTDCADDAAALLRHIGVDRSLVVGYSMGGAIAQLMARDHAGLVSGLVFGATSAHWTDRRQKLLWRALALVRLTLGLAPDGAWRRGLRIAGFPDSATTTWITAELTRGSASDLAEAGRELSRFDSRAWLGGITVPTAVIVTTKDTGVPPAHQRELAERLRAERFDVRGDHSAVTAIAGEFNAVLLRALTAVAASAEPRAGASGRAPAPARP